MSTLSSILIDKYMVSSLYAFTATWVSALHQERQDGGKSDHKKVLALAAQHFRPIFKFLRLSYDIDIPPPIDMGASYVIIFNHQHALDAYLYSEVG